MSDDVLKEDALAKAARRVGYDWRKSPYYDNVESHIKPQWESRLMPFIGDVDMSISVDLAAGHGRNSAMMLPHVQQLYIVDINEENINFCRQRFGDDQRIIYVRNNGYQLPEISSDHVTFFYCYDAMVHFDSDVVRSYLREIRRVLRSGGKAFLHHSNTSSNPTGDLHDNLGWRNFMSKELFAHYAMKEGLQIVKQEIVDWRRDGTNIDCFSLLTK
jgi:ubiquinone/menaquinone biosynthesis C-methylase UbiE